MIRRREFITLLGGAAAWPLATRAQQGDRMRRIGVLISYDENDTVYKSRVFAFTQALAGLGWTDRRNVRMDFQWASRADCQRRTPHQLAFVYPDFLGVRDVAFAFAPRIGCERSRGSWSACSPT